MILLLIDIVPLMIPKYSMDEVIEFACDKMCSMYKYSIDPSGRWIICCEFMQSTCKCVGAFFMPKIKKRSRSSEQLLLIVVYENVRLFYIC